MWRLILVVGVFGCCGPVLAAEVGSCEEHNVTLNQVEAMRQYANGSVKLFAIGREEPAAAPVGIAVAVDRGEDLSEAESFCRYVSGLSSAELRDASAVFDQARGVLTVKVPVRSYVADSDQFVDGTLILAIDKAAKNESGLVSAQLR